MMHDVEDIDTYKNSIDSFCSKSATSLIDLATLLNQSPGESMLKFSRKSIGPTKTNMEAFELEQEYLQQLELNQISVVANQDLKLKEFDDSDFFMLPEGDANNIMLPDDIDSTLLVDNFVEDEIDVYIPDFGTTTNTPKEFKFGCQILNHSQDDRISNPVNCDAIPYTLYSPKKDMNVSIHDHHSDDNDLGSTDDIIEENDELNDIILIDNETNDDSIVVDEINGFERCNTDTERLYYIRDELLRNGTNNGGIDMLHMIPNNFQQIIMNLSSREVETANGDSANINGCVEENDHVVYFDVKDFDGYEGSDVTDSNVDIDFEDANNVVKSFLDLTLK